MTYDDDNDYEELAEMKSVGDAAEISEAMIDEEEAPVGALSGPCWQYLMLTTVFNRCTACAV